MSVESIADIPTPVLTAMRDLCPKAGHGLRSVSFSTLGKSVTLTVETRARIVAELKRRREQRKGGGA